MRRRRWPSSTGRPKGDHLHRHGGRLSPRRRPPHGGAHRGDPRWLAARQAEPLHCGDQVLRTHRARTMGTGQFRASTFWRPSTRRCGVSAPTTSMCTNSTGRTPARRSTRPWRPSTTWSARARSATWAAPTSWLIRWRGRWVAARRVRLSDSTRYSPATTCCSGRSNVRCCPCVKKKAWGSFPTIPLPEACCRESTIRRRLRPMARGSRWACGRDLPESLLARPGVRHGGRTAKDRRA